MAPQVRDSIRQQRSALARGWGTKPSADASRGRILAASEAPPLRIHAVYQLENLDSATASFLKDRLIPATTGFFGRILKTKSPTPDPLRLLAACQNTCGCGGCSSNVFKCGEAVIPQSLLDGYQLCDSQGSCSDVPPGEGISGTDLVLFVTAADTELCGADTLAYTRPCLQDARTHRPVTASINFCPRVVRPTNSYDSTWDNQFAVAIHEITHALGFSSALYEEYLDEDGNPWPSVVEQFQERGTVAAKVVTPTVLAMARSHFNCPLLNGAELEGGSQQGTSGSHWSARIFLGEYMVGQLDSSTWSAVSNITLALLKDTGWYYVDFDLANPLLSGANMGCEFPMDYCDMPSMLPAVFGDYYCSAADITRVLQDASGQKWPQDLFCTYDRRAAARCSPCANCADPCTRKRGQLQWQCTDVSDQKNDLGMEFGLFSRCMETGLEAWQQGNQVLVPLGAGCYKMRCSAGSGGAPKLEVSVGGTWLPCVDGAMVEVNSAGYLAGQIGPCPVAAEICPSITCPNDCNAKGYCVNGRCSCIAGYTGEDCSEAACSPSSCSCDADSGRCLDPSGSLTPGPSILSPPATTTGASGNPTATSHQGTRQPQEARAGAGPPPPAPAPGPPGGGNSVPIMQPGSIDGGTLAPQTSVGDTSTRKSPDNGVVVVSVIRMAGTNLSVLQKESEQTAFIQNFQLAMVNGANTIGYMGRIEVSVDQISAGSIVVSSTAFFFDSRAYDLPDNFAQLIRSNAASLFGSSYFARLPAGNVTGLNANVQAAADQGAQTGAPSKDRVVFRKILGVSALVWIFIIGGALLACSFVGTVIRWLCWRRPNARQRQQMGMGTELPRVGVENPAFAGEPPVYPEVVVPWAGGPPPGAAAPAMGSGGGGATMAPLPMEPAVAPPSWASNYPKDRPNS